MPPRWAGPGSRGRGGGGQSCPLPPTCTSPSWYVLVGNSRLQTAASRCRSSIVPSQPSYLPVSPCLFCPLLGAAGRLPGGLTGWEGPGCPRRPRPCPSLPGLLPGEPGGAHGAVHGRGRGVRVSRRAHACGPPLLSAQPAQTLAKHACPWALPSLMLPHCTGLSLSRSQRRAPPLPPARPVSRYLRPSIQQFPAGPQQEALAKRAGFAQAVHYPIAFGLMGCLVCTKA